MSLPSTESSKLTRTGASVALRARPLVLIFSTPLWLACGPEAGDNPTGVGGSGAMGGTSAGTSTTGGTGGTAGQGVGGAGGAGTGGTASGGAGTGGAAMAGSSSGGSSGAGMGGALTGGSSSGGMAGGGESSGGTSGEASGGAGAGGLAGSGGDAGMGGASSAGASSGGTAGGSGAAGAGGGMGKGSPGCGAANPLATGTFMENINGTMRRWMLDVPSGYDKNKPYRLIFVWHPLGGSGSQVANGGYNGLKSLSQGTAVFATADGLNGSNQEASGPGWWNANGGDMKLVQAMLDKINAGLCIDQERIFSTGFSFGGMMSYTVGFEFDVFRAVAPCSGKVGVIPYEKKNTKPLPIMAFHGNSDTFVQTALGKEFLDLYAERNNCGTQTMPVMPNGCVEYQGCEASTTWCLFNGGHTTWSEEPGAIWKFFSSF